MARRGRPRHPDILTPREWEVLDLLREGLSNEQIAGRLGISLAGAKYHVSEILGKLGVSSRGEAAAWQPEQRPWWASALAPFALVWRRTAASTVSAVVSGALAGALAVFVLTGAGLLVWGMVRTGGGGGEEFASAGETGAPAPLSPPVETGFTPGPELTPPRPVSPPFEILGPATDLESLQDFRWFMLEVDSGVLFGLEPKPERVGQGHSEIPHVFRASWDENNRLLIEVGNENTLWTYTVDLGVKPVIRAGGPAPPPERSQTLSVASSDGSWTAVKEEEAYSGFLVGRTGEKASFHLTNTWPPVWAPVGHTLAFVGNICVAPNLVTGFDLFVFDPESGQLTNITDSVGVVWEFLWRPDASAIAFNIMGAGQLALVDVQSSRIDVLAETSPGHSLIPERWSPDGTRLLGSTLGGRGGCEGIAPLPETSLERLDQ